MRNKNINTEHIEGRVYQHDLSLKKVKTEGSDNYGKEYFSGTLDVATDEDGLNIITIHITYRTATTSKGTADRTYNALLKILNEGKTWLQDGKDEATKVKIDTNLALNDFYSQDGSQVSVQRNEGGFITIVNDLVEEKQRNTFTMDMVIANVIHVDADEDKNIDKPYAILRGYIFAYKNVILPVNFVVRSETGIKYFEDLEISEAEPIFTKVWGRITSTTVVTIETEESAFGEASVKKTEHKSKEWEVTGASTEPYDFGDPNILTKEDIKEKLQERDIYLAEQKKKRDEYISNSNTPNSIDSSIPKVQTGTWNF